MTFPSDPASILALLREIEWASGSFGCQCPICARDTIRTNGKHAPYCRLAATILALEAQESAPQDWRVDQTALEATIKIIKIMDLFDGKRTHATVQRNARIQVIVIRAIQSLLSSATLPATADIIRRETLEEAALACEALPKTMQIGSGGHVRFTARGECAAAIRRLIPETPTTEKGGDPYNPGTNNSSTTDNMTAAGSASAGPAVTLFYTNWRGEFAQRTIAPVRLMWGSNEWHPDPQWIIEALDVAKAEVRMFALSGFGWPALETPAVVTVLPGENILSKPDQTSAPAPVDSRTAIPNQVGVVTNEAVDAAWDMLLETGFEQSNVRSALEAALPLLQSFAPQADAYHAATERPSRVAELEAEVARLREALKPFAEAADSYDPDEGDSADQHVRRPSDVAWMHDFTIASLRRARAALSTGGRT